MSELVALFTAHPVIGAWVGFMLVSAAIDAMPEPTKESKPSYKWFYDFSHVLAGNLKTAYTSRFGKKGV